MRLLFYIIAGLIALTTIVLAGGAPVVSLTERESASLSTVVVPVMSNPAARTFTQQKPVNNLVNDPVNNTASPHAVSSEDRLAWQINRLTAKPGDQNIVETGFGKMLVPGEGGQTVVVARKVNGKILVEEY